MTSLGKKIVSLVQDIYKTNGPVHLHEPFLDATDAEGVAKIVRSGMVSTIGCGVNTLANLIKKYVGVEDAVCTVNGTAALHVALKVIGVVDGDLVLTQPLSFIATCNAIKYCGADPVFIDISKSNLSMCPIALAGWLNENTYMDDLGLCRHSDTGRVLRACLPVHTFGHPADVITLNGILTKYNIPLIEDAAEALGSKFKDSHVGKNGKLSIISFNGNKIITTGGGGCVLGSHDLISKVKHLVNVAKVGNAVEYVHDAVGFNYRMPNLNASLGISQFEKLDKILLEKRLIASCYEQFFNSSDVKFFEEPRMSKSNYWLNAIICDEPRQREELISETHAKEIYTRPAWNLLCDLPPYKNSIRGELTNAKYLVDRLLNLPSGPPRRHK